MTDEAKERREKVRQVLRETFGQTLNETEADKIAEKATRPQPVFHQRKPPPR